MLSGYSGTHRAEQLRHYIEDQSVVDVAIFLLALTSVSSTTETSVIGLPVRLKMAGYLKYWATQTVTLIP